MNLYHLFHLVDYLATFANKSLDNELDCKHEKNLVGYIVLSTWDIP